MYKILIAPGEMTFNQDFAGCRRSRASRLPVLAALKAV
jgi:hypothetical protein